MVSQKSFVQLGKSYLAHKFNYHVVDVRKVLTAHPDPNNKYKNCVFMILQSSKEQCDCVMFTPFDLSDVGMKEIPEPLEFDWQNARDCLKEYLIENNLENKGLTPAFHQFDCIAYEKDKFAIRFHSNVLEEENISPNKEKEAILADITNQKQLDKLAFKIAGDSNLDVEEKAEILGFMKQVLKNNKYKNLDEWIEKNPDKCGRPENQKKAVAPRHGIENNSEIANKVSNKEINKKL